MKLVTYLEDGRELVGVLTPDAAMVCPLNAFGYACTDMVEAIGLPKESLCTHCWDNSSYDE